MGLHQNLKSVRNYNGSFKAASCANGIKECFPINKERERILHCDQFSWEKENNEMQNKQANQKETAFTRILFTSLLKFNTHYCGATSVKKIAG